MAGEGARRTIERTLEAAIEAHRRTRGLDLDGAARAAEAIRDACAAGRKVLAFGNGGSAADAQHFAAELIGRFQKVRPALAALVLSADASVVTSVANDYGYDRVFARQIEALGASGDVALGITTSGLSPNVVAALETARSRGLTTVALTGRDGGAAGAAADIHVNVPERSTARVQEVHRTLLHAICEVVEGDL